MATRPAVIAAFLRTAPGSTDDRTDDRLLAEFFAHRDEAAFAEIVRRHQRTVWNVCRRFLSNAADAEDAFQATFLILVRRGRTLADRGTVGGWLYRVAFRVSQKARTMAIKRRCKETGAARKPIAAVSDPPDADLWKAVGEELDRLPENYRLAVILCDLDGLSRADAAARLGWNEGTLSTRLHRGRKRLAAALQGRGIAAPAVALATLCGATSAPASAVTATIASAASGSVPETLAILIHSTLREMTMRLATKWPMLLATGLLTAAFGGLLLATPEPTPDPAPKVQARRNAPVPIPKQPAWMANFQKAYRLKDGESVKAVDQPYIEERREFLLDRFKKNGSKPDEVGVRLWITMGALFLEDDGNAVTYKTMLSTEAANDGPMGNPDVQIKKKRLKLSSVIGICTGRFNPEVVYDDRAKQQEVFMECDLVVRKGVPLEKMVPDLQKVIGRCELDIHKTPPVLTLKEEEQEVYAVGGKFELKPREWREKDEVDIYANEAVMAKNYNHKTHEMDGVIQTGWNYSTSPEALARNLGSFLGKRMVWDVELPSVPKFHWYQHSRWENKATAEEKAADHDPEKVLKNVTEQTGLTFKKEKRKVQVLYVSVPEQK